MARHGAQASAKFHRQCLIQRIYTASKKLKTPVLDIGISDANREKIVKGLSALLADSYTLYLMTHNFHWNVKGPHFNSLHIMFMTQYTEQWNAIDLIAESIRARLPARTRSL
jgi:starvation-inducible DNA-binding protein